MKKLLIVEDDLVVRNIYQNKLALQGFEVEVAPDGNTGWDLVRSFRPDAVLLDLILPDFSGVELLRRIRETKDLKQLPVIVLSNTYLTSMVQEAWKAGATRCLAKASCTPRQVIEVILGYLENDHSTNEAQSGQGEAIPRPSPQTSSSNSQAAQPGGFDYGIQQDLRNKFTSSFPARLSELRGILHGATKAGCNDARLKFFEELQRQIQTLTALAGISGLHKIANIAAATDALIKALRERPSNFNASTLRTLASAIDSIGVIVEYSEEANVGVHPPSTVLVVDDEPISRKAVANALLKANLKPIKVSNVATALALLEENTFDLIFLDVDMPEMSGFELCAQIRAMPGHAKVPVVFVTGLSDFESRANSTISGGNDLIGKPFLPMELAVKALCYIFKSHPGKRKGCESSRVPAKVAPLVSI